MFLATLTFVNVICIIYYKVSGFIKIYDILRIDNEVVESLNVFIKCKPKARVVQHGIHGYVWNKT